MSPKNKEYLDKISDIVSNVFEYFDMSHERNSKTTYKIAFIPGVLYSESFLKCSDVSLSDSQLV